MDFIVDLPKTRNDHNVIFVIVHHLSKQAHFVLTIMTTIIRETTQLFIKKIYRLHGSKRHITSQCVYFVACPFWGLFSQKTCFLQEEFLNEIF
jgi:hypothetical protein